MLSIRLDKDVCSLSMFRARAAYYVNDVCMTGRMLLLTQYGKGIAVVIDVRDFEIMRERLEALEGGSTGATAPDHCLSPGHSHGPEHSHGPISGVGRAGRGRPGARSNLGRGPDPAIDQAHPWQEGDEPDL